MRGEVDVSAAPKGSQQHKGVEGLSSTGGGTVWVSAARNVSAALTAGSVGHVWVSSTEGPQEHGELGSQQHQHAGLCVLLEYTIHTR